MVDHASHLREASRILVNTIVEQEEEAMKALATPGKPPIYLIGPLMFTDSDVADDSSCLKWLD